MKYGFLDFIVHSWIPNHAPRNLKYLYHKWERKRIVFIPAFYWATTGVKAGRPMILRFCRSSVLVR